MSIYLFCFVTNLPNRTLAFSLFFFLSSYFSSLVFRFPKRVFYVEVAGFAVVVAVVAVVVVAVSLTDTLFSTTLLEHDFVGSLVAAECERVRCRGTTFTRGNRPR